LLLLSALIDGPDALADWLSDTTGIDAIGIDEPWRPTRTLRALCGVGAEETEEAERGGADALSVLDPAKRKTVGVKIPLRLLGALDGTWTGDDPGDYAIVDSGVVIDARVERSTGRIEQTGHTSPATRALTQHIAAAGQRLLVFLPTDRHAPFAYARDLEGPGPGASVAVVESFLTLADAEIAGPGHGRVSAVRAALEKGIALHSSAMTIEEQRASEIAFEGGAASVMLATGTLAQGLNLPATAVIIGGTYVGDAREARTFEGFKRAKAQLLNAIGRAGRAQTAARSLAIVVPSHPVRIELAPDVATARRAAPWLGEEDGSTAVESQLGGLIAEALSGQMDLATMDVPEQTAFAFLSFTAESGDARQVLARTLAAHRAGAVDDAERVTDALRDLGREYLDRNQSPAWIATAAHRAGVTLPAATALERTLRRFLEGHPEERLDNVDRWARLLSWILTNVERDEREALLSDDALKGTALQGLSSVAPRARADSARALSETLRRWLVGVPLLELGAALHGQQDPIAADRGKGNALPRTIRFVRDGIEHALTTVAGAMLATVVTGAESDPDGPWSLGDAVMRELTRLPVALRYGAADPAVLALMQAGLRPRVVAHLVTEMSPPDEEVGEDGLAMWARRTLRDLEDIDFVEGATADIDVRAALAAVGHVRLMS
jgi:hypothetical protein